MQQCGRWGRTCQSEPRGAKVRAMWRNQAARGDGGRGNAFYDARRDLVALVLTAVVAAAVAAWLGWLAAWWTWVVAG